MYIDDFTALVRRHAAPDAHIHYLKTRHGPVDVISVLDYNYPRRNSADACHRGRTLEDWYISSFVCNMTTNELPRWDIDGIWMEPEHYEDRNGIPILHRETPYWALRPATGYKPLLATFLSHGLIVPGWELNELLHYDTRRTCLNANRCMYIAKPNDDD